MPLARFWWLPRSLGVPRRGSACPPVSACVSTRPSSRVPVSQIFPPPFLYKGPLAGLGPTLNPG